LFILQLRTIIAVLKLLQSLVLDKFKKLKTQKSEKLFLGSLDPNDSKTWQVVPRSGMNKM